MPCRCRSSLHAKPKDHVTGLPKLVRSFNRLCNLTSPVQSIFPSKYNSLTRSQWQREYVSPLSTRCTPSMLHPSTNTSPPSAPQPPKSTGPASPPPSASKAAQQPHSKPSKSATTTPAANSPLSKTSRKPSISANTGLHSTTVPWWMKSKRISKGGNP